MNYSYTGKGIQYGQVSPSCARVTTLLFFRGVFLFIITNIFQFRGPKWGQSDGAHVFLISVLWCAYIVPSNKAIWNISSFARFCATWQSLKMALCKTYKIYEERLPHLWTLAPTWYIFIYFFVLVTTQTYYTNTLNRMLDTEKRF